MVLLCSEAFTVSHHQATGFEVVGGIRGGFIKCRVWCVNPGVLGLSFFYGISPFVGETLESVFVTRVDCADLVYPLPLEV